jgi:2-haloacid dehalogenase
MEANRRQFWATAAAAAGSLQLRAQDPSLTRERIRAIAFDGFVIFDPRAVVARTEEVFPGKGTEFVNLWRTRQFEYN